MITENGMIRIQDLAAEIREKILFGHQFKKFRSEDNEFRYLQFYECDLPSVAYKFDKITIQKIILLIKNKSNNEN